MSAVTKYLYKYDPLVAPPPNVWLAMGEMQRILLVQEYHEMEGIELPNALLHATIHGTIETQAAMGDELPVAETLEKLMQSGMDRHEAIHAIGVVLAEMLYEMGKGRGPKTGKRLNEVYFRRVKALADNL